jgi:hypothetical protein
MTDKIIQAISAYWSKLIASPVNVLLILFLIYQIYQKMKPFPGEEEPPARVVDAKEWTSLMEQQNKIVVCDFYATW